MNIDNWFKPALLILAVILLIIFYQFSENGRYVYHKEKISDIDNIYVVDTRTGVIYGHVISVGPIPEACLRILL